VAPLMLAAVVGHSDCKLFCVHCSDEALAGLLRQLVLLRSLNLDRCSLAGDQSLAAVGAHVSQRGILEQSALLCMCVCVCACVRGNCNAGLAPPAALSCLVCCRRPSS
jgi:hypothetical protein